MDLPNWPADGLKGRAAVRRWLQGVKAAPPAGSVAEFRARIEAVTANFAHMPSGTKRTVAAVGGLPGAWVDAPGARPDRVMLYLHGGTYVGGSSQTHAGLAARLSAACACRVFVLDYRRAPEHPFPAAVDDAVAAYDALRAAGWDGKQIVVAGDSAGSALAVDVALAATPAHAPAGLVLLSPWTDLAFTGPSFTALEAQDPWMNGPRLQRSAGMYLAGAAAKDPRASPLYAQLQDLPPTLVHVGADEVLLDDAVRFARRAKDAGVAVHLHVAPGLWHVWHLFASAMEEGQQAIADIGAWTRGLPAWGRKA